MTAARQIDIDQEAPPTKKIDGRSKAARAAREAKATADNTASRGSTRSPVRETVAREPARSSARGDVVLGRNGEVLTRKRTTTKDIFDIPKELVPENWTYQWCAVSVVGNTEILMDQNLMMAENGWRPVPASRYPGRFMPVGSTTHGGNIVRGGQMLMERPKVLSDQARAEDIANAKRLVTDRDQSLMGGKANLKAAMQNGMAMGGKYRGTGGDVRISIDPALDIPMPSHTLAEPGE